MSSAGAESGRNRSRLGRLLMPFQEFARTEASSGILLLLCAVLALAWANSPWSDLYTRIWRVRLSVGIGELALSKMLLLWINDGLMAIFFLLVGLEIKRELLVGELDSRRKAALPAAAALGGMLVPAGVYLLGNSGQEGMRGWGIPMATDIAFALGVLTLLGPRVPTSLKVFVVALAIVDDIGAVLVIALFYTDRVVWSLLALAGFVFLLLVYANRLGITSIIAYSALGVLLWLVILQSGVHATVAGVLLAVTIPARTRISGDQFLDKGQALLKRFAAALPVGESVLGNEERQAVLQTLDALSREVQAPLQRLEHALHPWVAYLVMPLFALANAGVTLERSLINSDAQPVALGVLAGLLIGKPLGITTFTWLAVRSGLARLPVALGWREVTGGGALAGIGFTMSLFIAGLAFPGTELLPVAKASILSASLLAGVGGWILLAGSPALQGELRREEVQAE